MNLSLTRHHADDDTLDVDSGATASTLATDAVDDALRATAGRALFSTTEAVEVLDRVRSQVDRAALGATVTDVLDAAETSFTRDALIDGTRLEDALLDLRLAIRG